MAVIPCFCFFVIAVIIGFKNKLEGFSDYLVIFNFKFLRLIFFAALSRHECLHHIGSGCEAETLNRKVADFVVFVDYKNNLIVILRPCSLNDIILLVEKLLIVDKLLPRIHLGLERWHHWRIDCKASDACTAHHRFHERNHRAGINLIDSVWCVGWENIQLSAVGILDTAWIILYLALVALKVFFEFFKIIWPNLRGQRFHHACRHRVWINLIRAVVYLAHCSILNRAEHGIHIHCSRFNHYRIRCQRFLLNWINISLEAARKSKNQRNSDDADTACKWGQEGSHLLCQKIIHWKRKSCGEGHRCFSAQLFRCLLLASLFCLGFFNFFRFFRAFIRVGIGNKLSVNKAYYSCWILFGKLGVVSYHDNELFFWNLFQKLHNLNARFGIKSARGLIGKQDIGVVNQCSCNGNSLHLTARHLIGLFVKLISQAYLFKRRLCPLLSFALWNARKSQSKLNIRQYGLMGYQIILLKHKADWVVAVNIPIAVIKILGWFAVNNQITRCVLVKTADNIQKRCFAAAGMTENRNKFILSEFYADSFKSRNGWIARWVFFYDVYKL